MLLANPLILLCINLRHWWTLMRPHMDPLPRIKEVRNKLLSFFCRSLTNRQQLLLLFHQFVRRKSTRCWARWASWRTSRKTWTRSWRLWRRRTRHFGVKLSPFGKSMYLSKRSWTNWSSSWWALFSLGWEPRWRGDTSHSWPLKTRPDSQGKEYLVEKSLHRLCRVMGSHFKGQIKWIKIDCC